MARARSLAIVALLTGCLGPLLPLPPAEPRGAHEWLCINRACPREADRVHGIVAGVSYDRIAQLCDCELVDARGLAEWARVPPHEPHLVLQPFKR